MIPELSNVIWSRALVKSSIYKKDRNKQRSAISIKAETGEASETAEGPET